MITFSTPYYDVGSGGSVVTLSRPLVANATAKKTALLGIVGADINMEGFENFFKNLCSLALNADETFSCIFIDQKGK